MARGAVGPLIEDVVYCGPCQKLDEGLQRMSSSLFALVVALPVQYTSLESEFEVTLEPAVPVTATVILLHGLGADGWDFVPIVGELQVPLPVRFIFPHAPMRPVTVNAGYVMRAWYDIKSFTPEGRADAPGLAESVVRVNAYLEQEIARDIPFPARLEAEKSAANADVPILMCHGRMDPVVPIAMGIEARDVLSAQGYAVEWHEYPMQHEVCAAELAEIGRWLRAVLAPQASR